MTLKEVCLKYEKIARSRDSLRAELADYRPPPYFHQEICLAKDDLRREIRECCDQLEHLVQEYYRLGGNGVTGTDILRAPRSRS
jgi:hypothetical protein